MKDTPRLLVRTASRIFTRLSIVASLLLSAAPLTVQAAPKSVGDKVTMKPSILGGAPLKVRIYNFTPGPATGYWVTPEGILQSLPGAATIPPTGTKPIVIDSFRQATIFLQREAGGGMWKHLGGKHPSPFVILGAPPAGFNDDLKSRADEPGGEVPAAGEPAALEADKAKRKGPRVAKGPQVAEFLRIHNAARKDVGVSPLEWSDDLARAAQKWAERLAKTGKLKQQPDSKYGQNIDMGSGNYSPATAANAWLAEKAIYNPDAPSPKGSGKNATRRNEEIAKSARYTQMVWSKSNTVGYGIAQTADGKTVVVANYNPPGNVVGEKPYAK